MIIQGSKGDNGEPGVNGGDGPRVSRYVHMHVIIKFIDCSSNGLQHAVNASY